MNLTADSLTKWTNRDEAENTGPSYEKLDIAQSRAGFLTVLPRNTYWYQQHNGTMLYKTVTGDFIAATYVIARNRDNLELPPARGFNSAGLIARNPASASGAGNWVVLNVGMQQNATGTETKTTRNNESQLFLDNGEPEGELRLCRLADTFYFFRKLRGETEWRLLRTIARPDLPSTLQVGIMCNGYQAPADLHAEYDYVRFATPKTVEDCTKTLELAK
jgi:hypothetical protein